MSEFEDSGEPPNEPLLWPYALWAGIGSGLASLMTAGVVWFNGPDAAHGDGLSRLFLWPFEVWPWAIAGGIFGAVIWYMLKIAGVPILPKILMWGSWLIGVSPLVLCWGAFLSVPMN